MIKLVYNYIPGLGVKDYQLMVRESKKEDCGEGKLLQNDAADRIKEAGDYAFL